MENMLLSITVMEFILFIYKDKKYCRVAQLVEHSLDKRLVDSSSLSMATNKNRYVRW